MILKRIQVATPQVGLKTNSYIVCDEKTKEAMVIDPGGEAGKIAEVLDILEASLKYIFVTHCHADHIGAITELKNLKGGKILVSRADAEGLFNEEINLAYLINMEKPELEADSRLDDEDLIHIGDIEFKDILRVIWKELRVALIIGIVLGAINFVKLYLVDYLWLHTFDNGIELAQMATICITLIFVIIVVLFEV